MQKIPAAIRIFTYDIRDCICLNMNFQIVWYVLLGI